MRFLVSLVLLVMLILLFTGRFRASVVLLTTVGLFYVLDYLSLSDLFDSFTNISLMNLMLLLIVTSVISRSELVQVMRNFGWNKRHRFAKLLGLNSLLSAFLSNTVVVSLFMNALNNRNQLSKVLLPISYMTMVAGTCTLIGTSTNFIVNGFAIENGLRPLGIFEFSPIGILLILGGMLYLLMFSDKLLPSNGKKQDPRDLHYFLEAKVLEHSKLIGNTLLKNGLRNLDSLFLAEIIREHQLISPVSPYEVIEAGDILVFTGQIGNIKDLQRFDGLQVFEEESNVLEKNLVWTVLSHQAYLVGKTIKDINFRSEFDAAVVAIKRGNDRLKGKIGAIRLQAGDQLVLAVGNDFYQKKTIYENFYLFNTLNLPNRLRLRKTVFLLATFALAILLGSLNVLPLFKVLLILLFVYAVSGFITLSQTKRAVNLELFLIIGSSLALSKVMTESGLAATVADSLIELLSGAGVYGSFVAVYLMTALLTLLVTNNAVAALTLPIAYSAATKLHVSPLPFLFAVAYGASASFLSPYAYQTNTMVYSAGGYQARDFLKLGLGLFILYGMIVIVTVPLIFRF